MRPCVALLLFLYVAVPGYGQVSDLPELGNKAAQVLSPIQERYIGQDFFWRLLSNGRYADDHELQDYLQSLGDRIGGQTGLHLTFSLIQDNSLNAFAVPGGYITFHTGLISTTQTESELASVVGHEIAHVTQRHLPRLLARADRQKVPALAAILASVLIGGQPGVAGAVTTQAALIANQLSYTREFEREADAIGIRLLAQADFDPKAMAEFFNKLERYSQHAGTEVPPFLQTHPLTYTRIAESRNRAREYPERVYTSSFEYYLAKARIRALFVERQDDPLPFFLEQANSPIVHERAAAEYGTALALLNDNDPVGAEKAIIDLSLRYPGHPWVQLLHGRIETKLEKFDDGIDRIRRILEKHPEERYISYYLAQAYLDSSQPASAHKSLRYQIRRNPDDWRLHHLLSKTNVALDRPAEADQSKAEYLGLLGNYKGAMAVLKRALKQTGKESYLGQSIQSRIKEFEELLRLKRQVVAF